MSKIDDVMKAWQEDHQKISWQDLQTLKAENESLRAQLSEKSIGQGVPDGWRPIETAPKDGTTVLVSEGQFIYCVEWNEEFEWWVVDDNKLGPFRLRGAAPTHWMPLPTAPNASAPPAPQQKPLTDEQINQMWSDAHNDTSTMSLIHVLARAIEAAHNIGEKK